MNELYVDGGVITRNPSTIGGTWAFRQLKDGLVVVENQGSISPEEIGGPVTNNQTEMLALLHGLSSLPASWKGSICSDSQNTIGRASLGWRWRNIPEWMQDSYYFQRGRLLNWSSFKWVLLCGHPTRDELAAGIGKRGYPVSIHNVWCDEACQQEARKLLASRRQPYPGSGTRCIAKE